ncbi:EF-hand domain-containing protein [Streptomyces sp. WAC05374]|uniref:EF-hand domain-containing protein n=1 Tax=unclassified Streptomyces TaxID=2593676 RepID=UPI000F89B781|nr:EF-hand domain-containing protein [Streptomyces sp. WAC05374]RST19676.1 EF-hand domain-containing protein [Streptomyces sp. WAC05374]TDF35314.1 EF-hand domain-containing protein [Streptomyces sp. WAC05374]TDF57713.1 EF-hand domain-containing protein [Streptomyces sp. WAC05374]TDF60241.1 EF-hand domain-containing protein [Streptomyces sp. WAC05374]
MPDAGARDTVHVSDIRRRKYQRLFDVLDVDGAGVLTEEGCVRIAGVFARASGHSTHGRDPEELEGTIQEIWRAYVRDGRPGHGARLTREDVPQEIAYDLAHNPDKVIRLIGSLSNVIFGMADADHDGRVRKEDAIRLGHAALTISHEEATKAWQRLDPHGTGHLDYETCLKAVTEFIVSEDPNAPGNWIFGRY